jgi:hypothetical protein
MRRLRIFPILIMCLFLLSRCNTRIDEQQQDHNGGTDEYQAKTAGGITLQWKTDTMGFLHVKVKAPTTGWVAVGFDPTIGMQDANIIIGYVSGDTAHIRDDYGSALNAHESDIDGGGEDNVTNKDGTESGGETEITFTIPLDSGDSRDRILIEGNIYLVLLAYGQDSEDNFDSYHKSRTLTSIDL